MLAECGQISGRHRPTPPEFGPGSTKLRPNSSNFDQHLAGNDHMGQEIDELWSDCGQIWPDQIWSEVDPIRQNLAQE